MNVKVRLIIRELGRINSALNFIKEKEKSLKYLEILSDEDEEKKKDLNNLLNELATTIAKKNYKK